MKTLTGKNNLNSSSNYSSHFRPYMLLFPRSRNGLSSSMKAFVSGLRCHRRFTCGADLSSVDVGFSLTVANGLVPLQNKKNVKERGKQMLEEEKMTLRQSGGNQYQKMLWP